MHGFAGRGIVKHGLKIDFAGGWLTRYAQGCTPAQHHAEK
jgi:hypothetical protein